MPGILSSVSMVAILMSMGLAVLTPASLFAESISLPATGQNKCYSTTGQVIDCAGTGQDGELQAGIQWPEPRFSDNDDGTLTDNLTGLVWLKNTDCFDRVNWAGAPAAASGLADGDCGLSDGSTAGQWRLPNILELSSLANMGPSDALSWLSSYGFTGVDAIARWSSTIGGTSIFLFQLRDRFIGYGAPGGTYKVWPVRGAATGPAKIRKTGQKACFDVYAPGVPAIDCAGTGQDGEYEAGAAWPDPRFTDNNNGTITDNLTGLVWLQDADCFGIQDWQDALTLAVSLSDGSCSLADGSTAGDWRVPNTAELNSLAEYSLYATTFPAGHPFTNVPFNNYWTSTSLPSTASYGFFGGGGNYQFYPKSGDPIFSVLPVRDGEPTSDLIFFSGFE